MGRMLQRLTARFRAWRCDERGAAAVEFVLAVPIIFGMIAVTAEFSRVIMMQHRLEVGVRNAARYLTRLPVSASGAFSDADIAAARAIVTSTVPLPAADFTITIPDVQTIAAPTAAEALRQPFRRVDVFATVPVDLPLVDGINLFRPEPQVPTITIGAWDRARYYGE